MRKLFQIWLLTLFPGLLIAQNLEWGLKTGVNYGGPVGAVENASGTPLPNPDLGMFLTWKFSEKWALHPEFYYTRKAAEYRQRYRRDTIVEVEIQGVTGSIPTFYNAAVEGKIQMDYFEMPLLLSYTPRERMTFDFGPYVSYLLSGYDRGSVFIEIGEDGFITDTEEYNNTGQFRQLDYGFQVGGSYHFPFGLSLYLRGSRGLTSVFQQGYFANQGQKEIRLVNTFVHLGVRYHILWFREKE